MQYEQEEVRGQELLNIIKKSYEKDDSEFKINEQKPYEEFKRYLSIKYRDYRKYVDGINKYNPFNETSKNDTKSDCSRKKGNCLFAKGEYSKSLNCYYNALALAASDENKTLCYGNISAVFFKTGKLESCLAVIEHVKKLHSSKDNYFKKISKREEQCQQLLKNKKKINYPKTLPLSYPKNPNNHEIVNCIKRGPKGGVVANQALKMGDVIAVTKPFLRAMEQTPSKNTCSNCWKDMIETNIAVCDNCVCVMYCSEECKSENLEFHKLICGIRIIMEQELMALEFAFKVISKGIDIDKDEFKKSKITCCDWKENNFENQVRSVISLKTESFMTYSKSLAMNHFFMLLEKMKKTKAFKNLVSKLENGEELFFKTYWKIFGVISANSITSHTSLEQDCSTFFEFLMGLFNHSCVPNVFIFRNKQSDFAHYVLLEDVKLGDELFIAFEGGHFVAVPKEPRRHTLISKYQLDCKCQACIEGWDFFGKHDLAFSKLFVRVIQNICLEFDKKGALSKRDVEHFMSKISKFNLREKFTAIKTLYKAYFGFEFKC
ncbi:hypothetical protein ACFFRR_006920 [Megaselia abdita]